MLRITENSIDIGARRIYPFVPNSTMRTGISQPYRLMAVLHTARVVKELFKSCAAIRQSPRSSGRSSLPVLSSSRLKVIHDYPLEFLQNERRLHALYTAHAQELCTLFGTFDRPSEPTEASSFLVLLIRLADVPGLSLCGPPLRV